MTRDSLLYGLKAQIQADSTDTSQQLARFVIEQRGSVRLVDRVLRGPTRLASAFSVLNAARCYLRMRENGPAGGILSVAYRPNERRATDELHAILSGLPWCDVEIDLQAVGDDLPRPVDARRLSRIAGLLAHRYEPFRRLRALELVAYHARLSHMLDRGRYRIAVMSSYMNPWGIALNVAARRRGLPVVLVMHGMPQWPLPRLDYDLAIVNNIAARDMLLQAGCRIDRIIIKSGLARYRPMRAAPSARNVTVGVLLSKDPVPSRVTSWLRALARHPRVGEIIVRKHPSNQWTDLEAAVGAIAEERISLSALPSSLDDVRRCDFVVAGNSSVHVDAVAAGVPSVYAGDLDGAVGDIVGFARDGLVVPCEDPAALDLDAIERFYARPAWRTALSRLVNIDQSDEDVAADTRDAFREMGVG